MGKKIILVFLLLNVFLFNFISAGSVEFFYSPTCPHCEAVKPLVNELYQTNFDTKWGWLSFDITKEQVSVQAVPLIHLKTNDCRNIYLVGSYEIEKYLKCELQEQSTLECMTSPELNKETNSFFIRE